MSLSLLFRINYISCSVISLINAHNYFTMQSIAGNSFGNFVTLATNHFTALQELRRSCKSMQTSTQGDVTI